MNLKPARAYIEATARARLQNNKTERHVHVFGEEIEHLGAAGELAARRFLKLPETLHTRFDAGMDIHWRGYKIDVKTTRLTYYTEFRYLQWPKIKPVKADIVLLVAVDLGSLEAQIIGYATRNEIVTAPINESRKYPCHEIPISELHSPWNLFSSKSLRARLSDRA